MKFKIRKLTQKDLPALLVLFNTVLQEDFPEYQPKVAAVYKVYFNDKFFTKFLLKKTNSILGAFANDVIVAVLVIMGHDGGVVEFNWLFVNKNYRNNGLASELLKKGENWALEKKYHYIMFHTENIGLVEFYKKRGYEHVGLQKKMYFGIDEHLMQKVLRDKPFEEIFAKYLKD